MKTNATSLKTRRLAATGAALVTVLAAATGPALAAPGDNESTAPGNWRGTLVSVETVEQLSPQAAADQAAGRGYPARAARYGVTHYRVVYRTPDEHGRLTTASGLVSLPERGRDDLRVVVYEHGTMAARAQAPSVNPAVHGDSALFAAAGYAVAAPDYLGLGLGPGPHPYGDLASEVTASVDLLRAARSVAHSQGHRLDPRVQVTGFSQGGPAAMALGRALQSGADRHFRLGSLAPVSGPYATRDAEAPAGLDGTLHPKVAVYYFAYWLTAMNRLHHLYDTPSELFQAPYDQAVEALFDGTHSDSEILQSLPDTPQQLLTPHGIDWALHPTGGLLAAFEASDSSCDWAPRVPVRVYAASGDRDVALSNAQHCAQALTEHGAQVTLTDVGTVEHSPSRRLALPQVAAWFEERLPA
ncbi:hypothetical protein F4556_000685 [Kitasatospora gansuensis]|uniref:Lipase n=1 Tax=Kitasatospora gansuensis TaxID=258050 RepID=A0A7W7WG12_9ACTN|nr:lipase family protein [Kitasatospora gansuensis]MBB4945150.1 hypothetical protein [Kitasatospora gansuensis]